MFYTDNPVADAENNLDYQERQLAKLPHCGCCKEPIQQEQAIFYDKWYCEDCEDEFFDVVRKEFLVIVEA